MHDENLKWNCSFCGANNYKVNIVTSQDVSICLNCAKAALELIDEERKKEIDGSKSSLAKLPKPVDIFDYLSEYIVGQEDAKRALSVAVYNHYKRISPAATLEKGASEIVKSNVLLMGPTGTGKTYLAKILAKIMDVPFVVVDATSLTEAGYIGEDVDSILVYLLQAANGEVEEAERGIIYIDEIDKIARRAEGSSQARDVSGEGVQQGLLKIIEGAKISIPIQNGRKLGEKESSVLIDTSNILFICSGAFVGLEEIIGKRVHKSGVGFGSELKKDADETILSDVEIEDLQKFGLIPEFIGRLPVVTSVKPLTKEQLVTIMKEPKNSLIKQFKKLFELDGVNLEFEDEALELIAQLALDRKTGARGLRSILEKVLKDTMFEIPSRKDVGVVLVTKEAVETSKPMIIPKITKANESNNSLLHATSINIENKSAQA